MQVRKSIGYAFATSPNARELGHGKTGCYYIRREVLREDGTWSPSEIWPGSHGEAAPSLTDPNLLALFDEIEAPQGPYCQARHNGVRQ